MVAPNLTMKGLFRGNGTLNMSPADSHAIGTAGHRLTQHGDGKQEHDDLDAADHQLHGSLEGFEGAGKRVEAGRKAVDAAETYIEVTKLRHEVAEDRDALEEAQHHAEVVKSGIEFFAGGLTKFAVLEAKEFGDLVESIGVMASYAVGRYDDHSIAALEQKLKADTKQLHSAEGIRAYAMLEVAKLESLATVHEFRKARDAVLVALQNRQRAYNKAGRASAANSDGNGSSRSKILGVMTAIPAVELVLGLARNLAQRTASSGAKYSNEAGSGFNMAVQGQRVQATHLISALDQIEYVRIHFAETVVQWNQRLISLRSAQTLLGGHRPDAQSDEAESAESEDHE
jgi:hypothetical protein